MIIQKNIWEQNPIPNIKKCQKSIVHEEINSPDPPFCLLLILTTPTRWSPCCTYFFPIPFSVSPFKVFFKKSFICLVLWNRIWKEYFPNLPETWFWDQIFVYWARYFKFWLLAYFFILLNCAKFEEDKTTFILHILQGSPLWCFLFL